MKQSSEGSPEQKRAAAREARAQGKSPSEMGATTGASKQAKKAKKDDSHQERLDTKRHGKAQNTRHSKDEPRPGNRDRDPRRIDSMG